MYYLVADIAHMVFISSNNAAKDCCRKVQRGNSVIEVGGTFVTNVAITVKHLYCTKILALIDLGSR